MRSASVDIHFVRSYSVASFEHVQNFERTPPDKDVRLMIATRALVCDLFGSRALVCGLFGSRALVCGLFSSREFNIL